MWCIACFPPRVFSVGCMQVPYEYSWNLDLFYGVLFDGAASVHNILYVAPIAAVSHTTPCTRRCSRHHAKTASDFFANNTHKPENRGRNSAIASGGSCFSSTIHKSTDDMVEKHFPNMGNQQHVLCAVGLFMQTCVW